MQLASSLEKRIDHCVDDFIEEHLSKLRVQTWSKLKLNLFTQKLMSLISKLAAWLQLTLKA